MWHVWVYIIVDVILIGAIIINERNTESSDGFGVDLYHPFISFCLTIAIALWTVIWGGIYWW